MIRLEYIEDDETKSMLVNPDLISTIRTITDDVAKVTMDNKEVIYSSLTEGQIKYKIDAANRKKREITVADPVELVDNPIEVRIVT